LFRFASLPSLLTALALAGCGAEPPARPAGQAPTATPTSTPTAAPAPVPGSPAAVAATVEATHAELRTAIAAWRETGGEGALPPAVTRPAAAQQRQYARLAERRRLAARVLPRLRGPVRAELRDVIAARRAIAVLNQPRPGQDPPKLRVRAPEPPAVTRAHYRAARRRFGIGLPLLAAVHFVETRFGRLRNDSVAGAQGPMQFMPATWAAYGLGGDIHDPRDAILGAANYLRANGAPGEPRRALYHYNPSQLYVAATSRYMSLFRRDPPAFYALYAWPVRGR
jgi:membrane-bound lytic murein transglycosylase B